LVLIYNNKAEAALRRLLAVVCMTSEDSRDSFVINYAICRRYDVDGRIVTSYLCLVEACERLESALDGHV
jgi:hypothetical protein